MMQLGLPQILLLLTVVVFAIGVVRLLK